VQKVFISINRKARKMKASTAIYQSIIKPAFLAGLVWLLVWGIMKYFGITSVLGWDINFTWIFSGAFVVITFWPDSSKSESPDDNSSFMGAGAKSLPPAQHGDEGQQAIALGSRFYESGEHKQAFDQFMKAVKSGNVHAYFLVGRMLDNGMGVAQDYIASRKFLEFAAEAGDPDAMYYVGCGYSNDGNTFPKDEEKSVSYLRKAAAAGHADALAGLGNAYYFGIGVPKDVAKAHAYYRQAIAKGSTIAELSLQVNV
jgi:Sel1 repeat